MLEFVGADEARVVVIEPGELLPGHISLGGRTDQLEVAGEEDGEMSLGADQPDRPHGALQVLPDLQISEALQVREKAHAGLAGDALQLETAQILVAIKHVLSGRPSQQQVDQTLAAVTMDRVCNQLS